MLNLGNGHVSAKAAKVKGVSTQRSSLRASNGVWSAVAISPALSISVQGNVLEVRQRKLTNTTTTADTPAAAPFLRAYHANRTATGKRNESNFLRGKIPAKE